MFLVAGVKDCSNDDNYMSITVTGGEEMLRLNGD